MNMVTESENYNSQSALSPFEGSDAGQGPFDDQARRGFEQYSQTFGKFLSDKDHGKEFSEEEKTKRDRAKKANKIYKQVCEDLRLKACFFNNFGDWSEYVDGKMSDAEFHNLAATRARGMMDEN
jgi:hypothetical protein